jgi:hypothetical protein
LRRRSPRRDDERYFVNSNEVNSSNWHRKAFIFNLLIQSTTSDWPPNIFPSYYCFRCLEWKNFGIS